MRDFFEKGSVIGLGGKTVSIVALLKKYSGKLSESERAEMHFAIVDRSYRDAEIAEKNDISFIRLISTVMHCI